MSFHSTFFQHWKEKPETIQYKQVWPWSARLVWAFFFLITEVVVFEDVVMHGAAITTKHLFTQGLLLGTTYFAHMVWPQLKQGRLIPATLAFFLACVGGYMVFVLSTGRNTEASEAKALAARTHNQERKLLEGNVAKTDAERTAAATRVAEAAAHQAKADGEVTGACQGGVGPICLGARSAASAASARLAAAEKAKERADEVYYRLYGKLNGMKAMQVEDAEIKAIAGLLATLPWVKASQDELIAWHKIGIPAGLTAFSEIALLVSAAIRKRVPVGPKHFKNWNVFGRRIVPASIAFLPSTPSVESKQFQPRKLEIVRKAKTSDEQHVLDALATAGRPLSCEELAEAMAVSPSESTKRRQVCEASGVVRTERVGKYLMVSPAA